MDAADALAQRRTARLGELRIAAHDRLQIGIAAAEITERAEHAGARIGDRRAGQEARQAGLAAREPRRDLEEAHAGLLRRVAAVAGVEREVVARLGIDARREPGR